jgi:hypothetical protein
MMWLRRPLEDAGVPAPARPKALLALNAVKNF